MMSCFSKALIKASSFYFLIMGLVAIAPSVAAEPVLSGGQTHYRTRILTREIPWHKKLAEAKTEAAKNNKLIFWVQMLGDIGGHT